MMDDPLSNFLQNGRNLPNDAMPVSYKVTPAQPSPQRMGFFDMLNPMNWLKQQIQSHPEYQQVMDVINQNGGDAKAAFYNKCKEKNVDPNQILQQTEQLKNNPTFSKFFR